MSIENKIPMEQIQKYVDEPFEIMKYPVKDSDAIVEIRQYLSIAETQSLIAELISFCFDDDVYHPELFHVGRTILFAKYASNLPMIPVNNTESDSDDIDIEKTYHYFQTMQVSQEDDDLGSHLISIDTALFRGLLNSGVFQSCEETVERILEQIHFKHDQIYFDAINDMSDMFRLLKTGITYVKDELADFFQSDEGQKLLMELLEQIQSLKTNVYDGKIIDFNKEKEGES